MTDFWLGSESSWDAVVHAQQMVEDGQKEGRYMDDADSMLPKLWGKQGNTAIVNIKGSLINGRAGWMRLFGVVGYDELGEAIVQAAEDPDVKNILFHVDSGGGQVAGLAEFGRLVSQVSGMKNSATYTNTKMASAAYWAGSAVKGPIWMDATAEAGSLGVLQVHTERSKALAAAGITTTVMRAGEMKARVNPFEELTPEAKAHLQEQLDDLHDIFRAHVKSSRKGMTTAQLKEATDGRTFLGKRAVDIGLVDSIMSYGQALKLLDKNLSSKHTSSNSKGATMAIALSTAHLAKLAFTNGLTAAAVMGADATDEDRAAVETEIQRLADEKAEADRLAAEAAAAAAAAGKEGTGMAAPADQGVVAHLQSQLDAKTIEAANATAALTTAKAQASALQAEHAGLLAIARQAMASMLIPMGGTQAAVDAMDAATIVAQHGDTHEKFLKAFPVGGVAGKTGVEDTKDKTAQADLPVQFRLLASQHGKK